MVVGGVGVGVAMSVTVSGDETGGVTRTVVVAVVPVGSGLVGVEVGDVVVLLGFSSSTIAVDEVTGEVAGEVADVFSNVDDIPNVDVDGIDDKVDVGDDNDAAAGVDIADDVADDTTDDAVDASGVIIAADESVECLLCVTPTAAPIATPMSSTTSNPIKTIQNHLLWTPNMVGRLGANAFCSGSSLHRPFCMIGPEMASMPGYGL